ncbi:tRNA (adenosine(37)-N6)-dimethylallyltransferase MiaA [Candidatus Dependentiae bacterium]
MKNTQEKQKIIILTGPTASGKTSLSLKIAQRFPLEIVNADSRQMWKPLTIGTAKPDLSSTKIKHHLFDVFEKPEELTVVKYRELVLDTMGSIKKNDKIPLLVGGSMFYIKSLLFPPNPLGREISYEAKQKIEQIAPESRWQLLKTVDEKRADKLHKNDIYRVDRALGIWFTHGIKPSECEPKLDTQFDTFVIGIKPKLDVLRQRIHKRLLEMFGNSGDKNPWVEEVKSLLGTEWEPFFVKNGIIGYEEIANWLKKGALKDEKSELVEDIYKKTVEYARRQLCFWRSFKEAMQFCGVPMLEVESHGDKETALHLSKFLA